MVAGRRGGGLRSARGPRSENRFAGRARNVVQAGRDVHGGVRVFEGPVYQAMEREIAVPRQLGRPAPAFVNREDLFRALDALLAAVRAGSRQFAVLTGPAGVGKSASVDKWADTHPEAFADGHLCVDLQGFGRGAILEPSEVAGRFLRALGVKNAEVPVNAEERLALFRSEIAGRDLLIVLDNAASAAQVRPLLPSRPGPMVVVTSRRGLAGLESGDAALRLKVDVLDTWHAVELLSGAAKHAERVGAPEEKLAQLAHLCAGLPLALSLVAEQMARPRATLQGLVEQMEDRHRILEHLTLGEDQGQAVRAAFDSSYRALRPEHAEFFRTLGYYTGPDFSPGAAAALAGLPQATVTQYLDALEDIHLVEPVGERYRVHDLLRAFAIDLAQGTPLQRQAPERLIHWYAHSALAAARALGTASLPVALPELPPGVTVAAFNEQGEALAWFERERAGLAEALTAAEHNGGDLAWQLPAALLGLFMTTNAFDEWARANEVGRRAARGSGDLEAIAAMAESAGKYARQTHHLREAVEHLGEGLRLRRQLADARGVARITNVLGLVEAEDGRWEQAEQRFVDAAAAADRLGEVELAAFARISLGWAQLETGRSRQALASLDRAVETLRQRGLQVQLADAVQRRASALRALGQTTPALASATEAVTLCRQSNNSVSLAQSLREQAMCLVALGQPSTALQALDEALTIHQRLGDQWRAAAVHCDAGDTHAALKDPNSAAVQYRIAADLYRSLGHDAKADSCDTLATAAGRNP